MNCICHLDRDKISETQPLNIERNLNKLIYIEINKVKMKLFQQRKIKSKNYYN